MNVLKLATRVAMATLFVGTLWMGAVGCDSDEHHGDRDREMHRYDGDRPVYQDRGQEYHHDRD